MNTVLRRTLFALLPLLALVTPLAAQLVWEPVDLGIESGSFTGLYRTPGGAMLGTTSASVSRLDRPGGRWELVAKGQTWKWQFGSDSTGSIYAAGYMMSYRSTDDGRTWTFIDSSVTALAAWEGHTVVLLGAKGRSTDGGATWEHGPISAWSATMLPGGRLIAATDSVYVSNDTGRSWQMVMPLGRYAHKIIGIGDSTVLLTTGGLYRSTDAGATWSVPSLAAEDLAVTPDGKILLSSFSNYGIRESDGLYISADSGATWRMLAAGVPWSVGAGPDGAIWAGFTPELLRSTDEGSTWSQETGGRKAGAHTVLSDPSGSFYAVGSGPIFNGDNGGYRLDRLMRSDDDGETWRVLHDSVKKVQLLGDWGLLVTVGSRAFGRGWPSDIDYRTDFSSDKGETWLTIAPFNSGTSHPTPPGVNASGMAAIPVGADTASNDLMITTDRGATWTGASVPDYGSIAAVAPVGHIYASTARFGGTRWFSRILRSDDTGRSWTAISSDLRTLSLHPGTNDVLVAVTMKDSGSNDVVVIRTADGGASWDTVLTGPYALTHRDRTGTIHLFGYRNDSTIIASSTDGGVTWRHSVTTNTANRYPQQGHHDEIFIFPGGQKPSLARTTDRGMTWRTLDTATDARSWYSATSNARVILGASSAGLFRTTQPSAVPLAPSRAIPSLSLAPVPATDRIVVALDGAAGTLPGSLHISDSHGELVHSESIDGGTERATVDVSRLAAGVYVVELRSGAETLVGRFVINR